MIDNRNILLNEFIKKELKIDNFDLSFFGTGKDNITCLVKTINTDFVIQMSDKLNNDQRNLIQEVIFHLNNSGFKFAENVFEKRFFDFDGKVFQVMENLGGSCYVFDELEFNKILEVTRYIAKLHNTLDCNKFEKYSYGTTDFKGVFNYLYLAKKFNELDNSYNHLFQRLNNLTTGLNISSGLRKGIIHGDEVLKNILFDNEKNIIGCIDYEMMGYEDYLWGFVDYIRNYMKSDSFGKDEFYKLLREYEKVRPFTKKEKNSLENYLKLMILNTGFRYFLSLFEGSGFKNLYGSNDNNSKNKIQNCIKEFNKAHLFFNDKL